MEYGIQIHIYATLYLILRFILINSYQRYYYFHFTGEEIEAGSVNIQSCI